MLKREELIGRLFYAHTPIKSYICIVLRVDNSGMGMCYCYTGSIKTWFSSFTVENNLIC